MTSFTHLQLHTEYSLLEGMIPIKGLINKTKEMGMDAIAITDRGNLYGVLEFYYAAKANNIKPIIGCEVFIAPGSRKEKNASSRFHAFRYLILLCKNLTGYENLMKLTSQAYEDGFYYVPRIDKELLSKYLEGLICISPFYGGPIGRALRNDLVDEANQEALWFKDHFQNDFYIGLQNNNLPDQESITNQTITLAQKLSIKPVALNDVFYMHQDDAEAHESLMCIKGKNTILDAKHPKLSSNTFYLRSPQEMKSIFSFCTESIESTEEIKNKCHLEFIYDDYHAPQFTLPEGYSAETYFRELSVKGLENRLTILKEVYGEQYFQTNTVQKYQDRLQFELDMIIKMGFPGYFLIVNDFIAWAKNNDVPVGPGRGSAAGSLVAYTLRITDIDPLPYGLLFERFLNPERISMPDIDVDFCQDTRDLVLDYVSRKYGQDKVAHITTFGRMKAKAAIRDVGRVLGMPYAEVDTIAKLVPNDLNITIEKALKLEPKFQELIKSNPKIDKLIKISRKLEGLCRHASTHACGVVISQKPMISHVPTYRDKENEVVTQFEGKWVEKTGLIKFDFLGLKNLTAIKKAVELIRKGPDPSFDPDKINLDQKEVYHLLSSGNTTGVFQLESTGMRKLLKKLKPSCFEDCIALVALYRPGPLGSGMVDDFVDRKHGKKKVSYILPQLEDILKETYGVLLYQEQVQKTAVVLANYTLGEADILRKAMGKKIPSEMAKQKDRFLTGAKQNDIEPKVAEEIFELMAKFAEYGFNKSHSAAYGYIAYITAYLKALYPVEFLTACLSCDMENTTKVTAYLHNCTEMKIKVLPPCINQSMHDFSINDNSIRFGFGGVKNVGESAIEAILEARKKHTTFASIYDFCEKVDLRRVNKRVIESLIKVGCFDSLHNNRAAIYSVIGRATELAERVQKDILTGQQNIFDLFNKASDENNNNSFEHTVPGDVEEWPSKEKLSYELETLGRYMSGHPLDPYKESLNNFCTYSTLNIDETQPYSEVIFGGIICDLKETLSKKGDKMAFFSLEDLFGRIDVCVFSKSYESCAENLKIDDPVFVKGKLHTEKNDDGEIQQVKIFASEIGTIADLQLKETKLVQFKIKADEISDDKLDHFIHLLEQFYGDCEVKIQFIMKEKHKILLSPRNLKIKPSENLQAEIIKNYSDLISIEYIKTH